MSHQAEMVELVAEGALAAISPVGAELLRLRIGGRELIWPGDPASWPRSAPVLFPFCGWLNGSEFRHQGEVYRSGVHGFGSHAAFEVAQHDAGFATFTLHDTPETREIFPFAFHLVVSVRLRPDGLDYAFTVTNQGDAPLPCALGFHPGFRWPFAGGEKSGHRLRFSDVEKPEATRTVPDGLFTDEKVPLPLDGHELDIAAALRERDSIVMLDAASRQIDFTAPDGSRIQIETDGFPHWVFWSLPGADYLCIEGWTGQGDPVGYAGEIMDKPGMTILGSGELSHHAFSIRFHPA